VTVAFDAAANYPDIRILEYSGIDPVNPLDTTVEASGNSATSSSGVLTTTNALDLLVASDTVQTSALGASVGFAQRLLTSPDNDLAEDAIVTATGSYSANVQLSSTGSWVMQMLAFRAASATSSPTPTPSPNPTPNPTPTPTPTPIPIPTPTPSPIPSSSVALVWDADLPTINSATNATGYCLFTGSASGVYTLRTDVGNTTTATVSNLISGSTYYYVVTAYNSAGIESQPSDEVSYTAP
jgi:hypothetical protein